MDAGNWPPVLLTAEPFLQPPFYYYFILNTRFSTHFFLVTF